MRNPLTSKLLEKNSMKICFIFKMIDNSNESLTLIKYHMIINIKYHRILHIV